MKLLEALSKNCMELNKFICLNGDSTCFNFEYDGTNDTIVVYDNSNDKKFILECSIKEMQETINEMQGFLDFLETNIETINNESAL